jgi:hypothetical protein
VALPFIRIRVVSKRLSDGRLSSSPHKPGQGTDEWMANLRSLVVLTVRSLPWTPAPGFDRRK